MAFMIQFCMRRSTSIAIVLIIGWSRSFGVVVDIVCSGDVCAAGVSIGVGICITGGWWLGKGSGVNGSMTM